MSDLSVKDQRLDPPDASRDMTAEEYEAAGQEALGEVYKVAERIVDWMVLANPRGAKVLCEIVQTLAESIEVGPLGTFRPFRGRGESPQPADVSARLCETLDARLGERVAELVQQARDDEARDRGMP